MTHLLRAYFRLPFTQRLAVFLWAALLLGVGGRVLFGPARSHTVVPIYLTAADRWTKSDDLFAPAPPLDVYRNPPGFAAAFVPLTWLPERAAELLWRGFSAAVFLGGLAAWVRYGLPRPLSPGESGAVFALAVLPALPNLNNGQTNLVMSGALLFGAAAVARGRGVAGGGWLAAAAAVKVYPAAVGLLLAVVRPRGVLPWFAATGLLLAALPFVFQHPAYVAEQYRSFWESVNGDDRTYADSLRPTQDLYLVLRVWAVAPPPQAYLALKLAAAAGMAGLVGRVAWRTRDPRSAAPLALNLGCVWITVLGPATELPTYGILGPTAAALAVLAWTDRGTLAGKLHLAVAAAGYGLLVAPILRDMFPNGATYHALALTPVGGLLVLATAVWAGVRAARRPAASPSTHPGERTTRCHSDLTRAA